MNQILPAIYPQNIFNAQAVALNGPTSFGHLVPTGPGYYDWTLRVKIVVTIGTGAGAITNGILDFFRQIYLKGDNNEIYVDNLPARGLFEWATVIFGTPPRFDQIVAANGTYYVDIPIVFSAPFAKSERPHDLVCDSSRYKSMVFDILTGPLTDLFTAPGTAAVVITADLDCTRSKYKWNSRFEDQANYSPILGHVSYSAEAPQDANALTYINMKRAADINVMRVMLHTVTAGAAGRKFYGTNSDAVIDKFTIDDTDETHAKDLIWAIMQERGKRRYELETIRSGIALIDFVNDGSYLRALQSNRNNLRGSWTNQAGVGANYNVTLSTHSWRSLREATTEKQAA